MLIVFESDGEAAGDGFPGDLQVRDPGLLQRNGCLTAQADTISDGSGNWDYHNNSACSWKIIPEGASSVTLYFNEFETVAGPIS